MSVYARQASRIDLLLLPEGLQRLGNTLAGDGLDGEIFTFKDLETLHHTTITRSRSPSHSYPFFFVLTLDRARIRLSKHCIGVLGVGRHGL